MDIYERHKQAVTMWRKACEDVEFAEHERDLARNVLDNVSEELLASCAHSTDKPEKKTRRNKRTPKINGELREGPGVRFAEVRQ